MAGPGEKNISAFIDPEISEKFKAQCEAKGKVKYKCLESALRLWVNLPSEMQNSLIENPELHRKLVTEYLAVRLREELGKIVAQKLRNQKKQDSAHRLSRPKSG